MKDALGLRPYRSRERVIMALSATFGLLLPVCYAAALAFLVVGGVGKLVDVAWTPAVPSRVPGEVAMRLGLAAVFAGAATWMATALALGALRRTLGPSASRDRVVRALAVVGALALALLLRSRVPPFLIDLPSELHSGGGIGPQIFNTVYLAVLSTALTVPLAIAAGVYIARFARAPFIVTFLRGALDSLASLPSVVYGLFGFLVFVVHMRAGYSLLAGALTLALLNLPMVVSVTEESLRDVPRELEDASLALGATPLQTIWHVTLPAAWRGILGAVVLGVGRVFAESAPLMLTAGTAVSRATAYSLNPFRGGETLAVHLWYVNSVGLSPDRVDVSAGTAAVLVVLVGAMDTLAARLRRSRSRRSARHGAYGARSKP
jgi:phosphate transport system permease protein